MCVDSTIKFYVTHRKVLAFNSCNKCIENHPALTWTQKQSAVVMSSLPAYFPPQLVRY